MPTSPLSVANHLLAHVCYSHINEGFGLQVPLISIFTFFTWTKSNLSAFTLLVTRFFSIIPPFLSLGLLYSQILHIYPRTNTISFSTSHDLYTYISTLQFDLHQLYKQLFKCHIRFIDNLYKVTFFERGNCKIKHQHFLKPYLYMYSLLIIYSIIWHIDQHYFRSDLYESKFIFKSLMLGYF